MGDHAEVDPLSASQNDLSACCWRDINDSSIEVDRDIHRRVVVELHDPRLRAGSAKERKKEKGRKTYLGHLTPCSAAGLAKRDPSAGTHSCTRALLDCAENRPKGVIYSPGALESGRNVGFEHDDVCAFLIGVRMLPANCSGKIVFRTHGVAILFSFRIAFFHVPLLRAR